MRLALLIIDNRDAFRKYEENVPRFGSAPTALLEGFAKFPSLEVHIVSCTQRLMKSPAKLADNIYFHSLNVPKIGWMRTLYQGCIRHTRRKLREIRPDIVHGQGTERDCAIAAVLSGFPSVLTIHGNMAAIARQFKARPGSFHWLAGMLENWTLPRARGVFCNSKYTQSLVSPRNPRTWEVPNALRSSFFSPIPLRQAGRTIRLLNIGTITPLKRQLEILKVCENLHKRGYSFHMNFLGEARQTDAYCRDFLQSINRPETAAYATFSGFKEQESALIGTFDECDGCVHFSSEESFGLAVAEGLARNLKLFAARVGGVIDIMSSVEGAELFAPDDWRGLEESLAQWMEKGAPRPVTAAQTMKDRYHPQIIAQKHLEIYNEVLSNI
ncbi:MAG TPA: glycosyltransferase family 4 protein [Candidatus Methylacidiphilales bacterium]|nr:glycosyltransferase family 4 protein [Candidatus Methylacidiphilales bacterium]